MAKKINENDLKNVSGGGCNTTMYYYAVHGYDAANNLVNVKNTESKAHISDARAERDSQASWIFANFQNVVMCVAIAKSTSSNSEVEERTYFYR